MSKTETILVGGIAAGILLITYILFEFYYDIDERYAKQEKSEVNIDEVLKEKKRRKKIKSQLTEKMSCEICLCDVTSAISAIEGGASSIELCTNRGDGGITPFIGLVQEVVNLSRGKDVEVHVLIRPRPGNFVYSPVEFDVITRDIIAVKSAGADGIVIGILLENGNVDESRMAVVRSLCSGIMLTFHRAFDVAADPIAALESVIKLGCDRLLTSAQSSSARSGVAQLKDLTTLAASRIQIIAASGIDATNVFEVIMKSEVNGVHAGSSVHELVFPPPKVTDETGRISDSEISENSSVMFTAAISEELTRSTNWPPRSVLSGLSEGYECVSAAKVVQLVDVANTAWLLLTLEKGDLSPDSGASDVDALNGLIAQRDGEEKEEYGIISKATSADFSDEIFSDQNQPRVSIETSYVHVDVESSSKKKWSWFQKG